jgi:predicted nucleic acid-binding protein
LVVREALVAALEHGYALVTRDRDFEAVPELEVVLYDEH